MGMTCVVCNRELDVIDKIKDFIRHYFEEKNVIVDIDTFSDFGKCYRSIYRTKYDLYILDVDMPEGSGIELAKAVKSSNPESVIIFLTDTGSFYKEAYQLEVLQCIENPLSGDKFNRTLDRFMLYYKGIKNRHTYIELSTRKGVYTIKADNIEYVESCNHQLLVNMHSKEKIVTVNCSVTLKKLMMQLPDDKFILPYRGYIINVKYVHHIETNHLVMKSGAKIPIPNRQYNKISKIYSEKLRQL